MNRWFRIHTCMSICFPSLRSEPHVGYPDGAVEYLKYVVISLRSTWSSSINTEDHLTQTQRTWVLFFVWGHMDFETQKTGSWARRVVNSSFTSPPRNRIQTTAPVRNLNSQVWAGRLLFRLRQWLSQGLTIPAGIFLQQSTAAVREPLDRMRFGDLEWTQHQCCRVNSD